VIRIEYDNYKNITGNSPAFKEYRNSPDGQIALNDIYLIMLNKIMPCFDVCDKSFNKTELQKFLQVDTLDFNDKIILDLCRENNFVLLTNDADFKNTDIDILTVSKNLLRI
jgi:predicted nucleic acid-binding protein